LALHAVEERVLGCLDAKPHTRRGQRVIWTTRREIDRGQGGPSKCRINKPAAVLGDHEFLIGPELAYSQIDRTIQGTLLVPKLV
jgi:hypothetical protein